MTRPPSPIQTAEKECFSMKKRAICRECKNKSLLISPVVPLGPEGLSRKGETPVKPYTL